MFSYYGSKSKIIDLYPSPKYSKIIEPFAGSAQYSLKWWDREVILIDKYEVIIKVWQFLQLASPVDILGLPKMKIGDDIRKYGLSEGAILLLSFISGGGVNTPKWTVSKFGEYEHGNQNVYKRIANDLPKIKHWIIKLGSFDEVSNQEATWFIDPPYYDGGHKYKYGNRELDYCKLAEWIRSRMGQVIACENTKANWLPFWNLQKIQGVKNSNTTEAIWCNDVFQPVLF